MHFQTVHFKFRQTFTDVVHQSKTEDRFMLSNSQSTCSMLHNNLSYVQMESNFSKKKKNNTKKTVNQICFMPMFYAYA